MSRKARGGSDPNRGSAVTKPEDPATPSEEGRPFEPPPAGLDEVVRDPKPLDPLSQETVNDRIQDRELQKRFMYWMLGVLIGQMAFVNLSVVLMAWNDVIELEAWTLRIWIGGTLAETFAIVLVMAKYLFPKDGKGSSSAS